LFESSDARTLLGELPESIGPVQLVHYGHSLSTGLTRLADAIRERGVAVDVELMDDPYTWWAVEEDGDQRPQDRLSEVVRAWLVDRLATTASSGER
jgi:hypothetical protein